MGDSADTCGLRPGPPLVGELRVPGSKSIAQRALVCELLAEGETEWVGLPDGQDVEHARRLVADFRAGARVLRVGESGTLARLATAAVAFHGGGEVRLEAAGSLVRRGSPALLDALARAGVGLERDPGGAPWPLRVRPAPAPTRLELRDPSSSQEVSGLLIALAAAGRPAVLEVRGAIPSRPYVELTAAVLARFGAAVEARATPGGERFEVCGPLRAPAGVFAIEPDASLAAVALAAGRLSGGAVDVPLPADTVQGDARAASYLERFGRPPTRAVELDLSGEPDLAPVLAAVAAAVPARTRLTGLGTLPGKESSRIAVLAAGLAAAGCSVEATADTLSVAGPAASPRQPVLLDPAGDHRMAFAFALLGLLREGVDVSDPGCVAKSWPSFWDDLERLGARVVRGR